MTFGFNTICAALSSPVVKENRYDYTLLIDILYYDRDINKARQSIANMTRDGVIFRVPNKLWLIRLAGIVKVLVKNRDNREMIDKVDFFNPEHIYILQKRYIKKKLIDAGFTNITILPSRSLAYGKLTDILESLFFILSLIIYFITFRQVIITPSQLIHARKAVNQ